MSTPSVRVRRVYDAVEADDGLRILVDRVWPRGMTKAQAHLDHWCRQVAPSTELRRWYGHDRSKLAAFTERYLAELRDPERAQALDELRARARRHALTLLTATRDPEISHARVLAQLLGSGAQASP